MKKFNFLKFFVCMTLAFAATAFTGCVDDNEDTELPYLEVTPEVLTFDEMGQPTGEGDGKFIVRSNRPWELTIETADQEWVRPSVTKGNGNGEVSFNLPETSEGRQATLTFSLSNSYTVYKEQKVTIQQGNVITPELVYKETFGTEGGSATPYPTVTDYTGWDKSGDGSANVTYEGQNAQLRNSSPSNNQYSGYEGSGGTNLYFSATPNDFIVKEIALPEDVTSFSLTFGAYIYNPTSAAPYYTTYEVALSADGQKWTDPVPFEMTFVADKSWNLATSKFKFDKYYEKLYIKFSAVSGNNRIDDVTLSTGNGGTEVNLEAGTVDTELKVTTEKPAGLTATSAILKGSVSATASLTEVGFQYTENADNIDWNSVAKSAADEVAASFSKEVTGLTEGKVYAVRAYATSAEGDVYGDVVTFTAEPVEIELSCAGMMSYIKGLEVASGSQTALTDYVGKSFDAYIAANNEGGNLNSMLVVVDNTGEAASGLLFYGSKYNNVADYPVGAKITISVTDKSVVKNYNGVLEVMDVEESVDAGTTATMKVPEITASQLNSGDYCYMYVTVKELTYKGQVGDKWYSGTSGGYNRYFENSGEEVTVRTSKNAAYKDAEITTTGPAALSGVPQHNFYQDKTTIQVYPTGAADVAGFSAGATEPSVTTGSASDLTATGATLAGSSQNISNATEVGVKYAEYAESIDWSKSGTKVAAKEVSTSWEVAVTGLSAGTKYAYVAYAVTGSGTLYGEAKSFSTKSGEAADITINFADAATYPAGFPDSYNPGTTVAEYEFGGYKFTLSPGTGDKAKYYKADGALFISATGYLQLPALPNKSLVKVVVTSATGTYVSKAAKGSITDEAGTVVAGGEEQTWAWDVTPTYTYDLSGTAVNTAYQIRIANKNAQIALLELYYTDGGSAAQPSLTVDPTSLSFTADGDNTGKTISCTIANQGTLKLFAKSSDAQQFPVTVNGTSVVVKALANETTSEKNATVTIYLADSENGAQMASKTVSVKQAAKSGGSGDGSTIVVDFSRGASMASPALPGNKEAAKDGTYTIDGYTYVIHAADKFYWWENTYQDGNPASLFIGKAGSYIELPAVAGKALTGVEIAQAIGGGSGVNVSIVDASNSEVSGGAAITMNPGETAVWTLSGTTAGTNYRIYIGTSKNLHIAKFTLYYGEGGGVTPTTPEITGVNPSKVDFTADGGTTTINVTVSNQGSNALSATGLSGLFSASVSGNKVTVTAQPNTGDAVSQTLTIAVSNGNSVTVPVTMAAKSGGSEPGGDNLTLVKTVAELTSGTYYMAGWANNGAYNVWNGTVASSQCVTSPYSFADGKLTATTTFDDMAEVTLEVSGDVVFIKNQEGKYLTLSGDGKNKLTLADEAGNNSWTLSDYDENGVKASSNAFSGNMFTSVSATSKFIRSYAVTTNTGIGGIAFFKKN